MWTLFCIDFFTRTNVLQKQFLNFQWNIESDHLTPPPNSHTLYFDNYTNIIVDLYIIE